MLTGGTLHKDHYFSKPEYLDFLQSTLFTLVQKYGLELEAWALYLPC